jgi:predicted nucleotidyltransferase
MLQTILRPPNAAKDIALGAQLAKMHNRPIGPAEVARVLSSARMKYVIVGAHATNGYTGRPRTTIDVDVVVQFPKKAAKIVAAAFPELQMRDTPVVTRFLRGQEEAIDLMKPAGSKLWARLLKEARDVRIEGQNLKIPPLEGVLAGKFAAMVSIHRRQADKMIDGGDFIRIVEANDRIDAEFLHELAELVYPGGGDEILKLVADARAGRRLEF